MKINQIETFQVEVPARPGSWNSPEFGPPLWDVTPIIIIRLQTDAGVIGLGEVERGIGVDQALAYGQSLLGQNPLELNLQQLPVGDFFDRAAGIYEAYEMAIFDIAGKVRKEPAYNLLGGAFRDRVLVSLCTGQMTPQDAAHKARRGIEQGYRSLKMKATDTDPITERVAAIHQAVGNDLKIVIDPNERFWRPAVLDKLCHYLEPYYENIQCFEDPFNKTNLDWYRLMRQKRHFPLALHLAWPEDVFEAIKHEACDYLNLGGGMVNFHKTAAVAEAANIPVWHGSGVGLGISEAAILHTAAAARVCTLGSDVVGEKIRLDDLIVRPIRFEDGQALVPQEPGLGVELDMDAVARFGRVREAITL